MRRVFLFALVLASCKGKPTTESAPANVEKPGPGMATVAGSGGALPTDIPKDQQKDIVPPKVTNTAPAKTTGALALEKLKAMSEERFDEWVADVRVVGPKVMEIRHTTKSRPFVMVTVKVMPCASVEQCMPMGDPKWTTPPAPDKRAPIDQLFSEKLKGATGTLHENGTVDFFGTPMMFEYHLGYTAHPDENQNTSLAYSHAYSLFYNDGFNEIRVTAEYQDLAPKSLELLAQLVPKDNLIALARAFADHYTHVWN